jgi:NAD(P)-dependent dehydrogenase (short-subunit alcohol dehydrogenase family)
MDLQSRVALITGGKRIGAAVAIELARRGADVALAYRRSRDEAESTAAEIRSLGRRVHLAQADVADPPQCRRLVAETVAALGRLDVLVNMASLYAKVAYDALTDVDWERSMATDLRGAHLCAQAAVPHMRAAGGGRIVNFTDWVAASRRPRYTGYVPYYVAKMGVIALTEILALELAPDQILVNAIAPGPILAPPDITDEERASIEQATPVGRWGGPAEIVKAVLLLVETDFITGEVIRVDGGRHIR